MLRVRLKPVYRGLYFKENLAKRAVKQLVCTNLFVNHSVQKLLQFNMVCYIFLVELYCF